MAKDVPGIFSGTVEVDETYLGGQKKNERKSQLRKEPESRRGWGTTKQPVFGVLTRRGKVFARLVDDTEARDLLPIITKKVKAGSSVCSDTYTGLAAKGYVHRTVEHGEREYLQKDNRKNHINGLEGFFGYLKRKLAAKGGIRRKYLYLFLGEYVWRYNYRQMDINQKVNRLLKLSEDFSGEFWKIKYIYFLVIVGTILFSLNRSLPAYAQVNTLSCQGINLSASKFPNHNGMPVYQGKETITISVTGSTSTNGIELYWIPAYKPVNISSNWNKINGSYNAQSYTFTASWNLSNDPNIQNPTTGWVWPQEIIIAANNSGSSGFCSGSPCSASCPGGAYWANGNTSAVCNSTPVSCCTGCQKKIIIDPTVDLNASNAIDVKEYMLLTPGNYWEYSGTNYTYSESDPMRTFTSRIEIEAPTKLCGHKAVGMRFLKNKASGYWGPKHSYYDAGAWSGSLALRNSMFYFDGDNKWSNRFTGSPWWSTFNLLSTPNQFRGLGAIPTNPAFGYTTTGSQHFYYAPYLYAPRYLPADPTTWKFKREDVIHSGTLNDPCIYETQDQFNNDYVKRGHGWETKYGWEDVQTPAYLGKTLRIIFLEYGDPNTGFLLREDYFFAKGIGLVMVKAKDIYQKSIHDETGTISRNNCGSECNDNIPMVDSMLSMGLKKYYVGTPLTISSSVDLVKPQTTTTYWPVNFSNQYTGFIDYTVDQELPDGTIKPMGSGYWKDVWVENGLLQAPVLSNVLRGKFIYKFRRHLPDLPSSVLMNGETAVSYANNLSWSNSLSVSYTDVASTPTPAPIPGDVDKNGRVDGLDVIYLISYLGNIGTCPSCDLDHNSRVDGLDVIMLIGYL